MRLAGLAVVLLLALGGSTGSGPHAEPSPPGDVQEAFGPLLLFPVVREGPPPVSYGDDHLLFELPTPEPTVCLYQGIEWPCLTESEMVDLLERTGWPAEAIPAALRVSWCESHWIPSIAAWDDQADGLGSTGLFMLWSGWYRAAGYVYEDWMIPEVNASVALYAYRSSGWAPWSCRP